MNRTPEQDAKRFLALAHALSNAEGCDALEQAFSTLPDCASIDEVRVRIDSILGAKPFADLTPPFGSKRAATMALYQPPFNYHRGYVRDAVHQMVSDDDGVKGHIAQRVRGWGRIGYMPDAANLQDDMGAVMAEALTEYWQKHSESVKNDSDHFC